MDSLERITSEPDKRSGKPCIRGMRITVDDVLGYLASGMTEDEILADFPYLEAEDLRACVAYARSRNPPDSRRSTQAADANRARTRCWSAPDSASPRRPRQASVPQVSP